MKKFKIEFYGRKANAIGSFSTYFRTIEADSKENAILQLYKEFDSVQQQIIKEIS